MNKKSIVFLFLTTLFLSACSDNDKKKNKNDDPNKITSITCTVSGSSGDGFTANFDYFKDTHNLRYVTIGSQNEEYSYVNSLISVKSNSKESIRYTVAGDKIMKKDILEEEYENPTETFDYKYSGNYLIEISWSGTSASNNPLYKFNWISYNMAEYIPNRQTDNMKFEYDETQVQPANFPFRLVNSFTPVEFENFHPINFYYGNTNKHLVKKAIRHNALKEDDVLATYEFDYKSWGPEGNIITMSITETIFEEEEPTTTIYNYLFEYNYDPN